MHTSEYEYHAFIGPSLGEDNRIFFERHDDEVDRYRTFIDNMDASQMRAVLGNVFSALIAYPDEHTAQALWRQLEAHATGGDHV